MSLRKKLKKYRTLVSFYNILQSFNEFIYFRPFRFLKNFSWYYKDRLMYSKMLSKQKEAINIYALQPQLKDKTEYTPLDPIYFFQDAWAAGKIFEYKPSHHYDVGSSAKTIAIISQFVPTTMIDIRPLELELNNLFFKKGSILNLPFEDNSINSISSLCVVEHIGLGRYGDSIDVTGSEKAMKELQRVAAHGGVILFSVPVDDENKVFFNAHRAFTREYILEQFSECKLVEEKYILGNKFNNQFEVSDEFQVGLFMFRKN